MAKLLAILGDNVHVIQTNGHTGTFNQYHNESPLLGYYDDHYVVSLTEFMRVEPSKSIPITASTISGFDEILGISFDESGRVFTHNGHSTPLDKPEEMYVKEQVLTFQGMLSVMQNSWYGTSNATVSVLGKQYEQTGKLDKDLLLKYFEGLPGTSEQIIIHTVSKKGLIASINIANKGMLGKEINDIWTIETITRENKLIMMKPSDVGLFVSGNLQFNDNFIRKQ